MPFGIGSRADLGNSKLRKLVRIFAPTQRHCQQDRDTTKASDSFDPTRHPPYMYLRGRDEVSLGSGAHHGRGRLGQARNG